HAAWRRTNERDFLARGAVEIGQAHAARVFEEIPPRVLATDLQMIGALDVHECAAALRRLRKGLWPEALIHDRFVRARDESAHLAITDLSVPVGVRGAVKPGAHLVAEDARLECVPFVALRRR